MTRIHIINKGYIETAPWVVWLSPVIMLITVFVEEERKQRLALAVAQLLVTTRQLAISDEELYAEIERQTAVDSVDQVVPS